MKKDLHSCVFYKYKMDKSINENENIKNKYISEIVSYTPFLDNELINVNTIKHRIPDYKHYFFVYSDYHILDLKDTNVENENYKDIYSIVKYKRKQNYDCDYLFKFENRRFIYLKTYLKSLSLSRKYIFQLIHFYKYLLDGLQKLVDINMIHSNVQLDKIIIDELKDNSIYLTDFSHSIEIQTNKNVICDININTFNLLNFQEFAPDNNIHLPVEFHLLSYMTTRRIKSLSQYNIYNIIDMIYKNNTILQTFGCNQYINDAKDYYCKYINKTIEYIWNDMCIWFYTWDNYSLSIEYLKILIGLHNHLKGKNNNCEKNNFLIEFMKLLVINIHPNPSKRKNIQETLQIFNNIIYSFDTQVYRDLIINI
jgi:hypothetical protein